ncbi:MAG: hypothetical protein DBX44_05125 [Oscillospiraceae bacterium]|nr:MAG: hypothetical protein DBX44_05125 [Oscillospiraceae bacterium]
MIRSVRHRKAAATVIVAIIAAALLSHPRHYLTLRDRDTGELYGRYALGEGERFSIGFTHSINLSPVIDVYQIENGDIYVEETVYYHFGAGVQTQLNEGETLSYGEDSSMVVGNIHQKRNNVGYIVGTVYDHILTVDGQQISLRDLCGRNAAVRFNYEFLMPW